jgi:D-amino-acid dehydrogenase
MGHTTNPLRLTQAYAALLRRLGGQVVRAEARGLQPSGAGVAVHTGAQSLRADAVVVAAGAWSAPLLRPLGLRLPLVAERGYHVHYAQHTVRLNHVVTDVGAHGQVTLMEDGLRIAGTEEIGLPDDPPSWRRADVLDRLARRMFPGARLEQASRWMGPRPGLPDSLPALGPVKGAAGVFVASGHGHLGLTGAPHTGTLVAAMVCGETPALDMAPYAPGRFVA